MQLSTIFLGLLLLGTACNGDDQSSYAWSGAGTGVCPASATMSPVGASTGSKPVAADCTSDAEHDFALCWDQVTTINPDAGRPGCEYFAYSDALNDCPAALDGGVDARDFSICSKPQFK